MTQPALAELTEQLAGAGFLLLGGFPATPDDHLPKLASGQTAAQLLMIGSTGPSLWPTFSQSPEFLDGSPNPMDRYTRRILNQIASKNGFDPVFPFDGPPYHPFQQWALKCGGFSQSPLGPLTHQDYGPWLGFRAAFLSGNSLKISPPISSPNGPCDTCHDKPCLNACPVSAISLETGYDVPRCQAHLRSDQTAACWSGCLARHACPFGQDHRQSADNARFHMESFVGR